MDLDQRVFALEQNVTKLFDRMGKVEDKASGAWKTITETHDRMGRMERRMDKMESKLDSLEVDVKDLKTTVKGISKSVKVLAVLIGIVSVISLGFFVYIWRHDAELAKSIVSLGTLIGKALA